MTQIRVLSGLLRPSARLAVPLVFAGVSLALAAACLAAGSLPARAQPSPLEALQAVVAAQNAQDWDALLNLTVAVDRADLAAFRANDRNRAGDVGLFNIQQASLAEFKELPPAIARQVVDLDGYISRYGGAVVFYAGVDYRVRREDRFHYNGVNYRLAVLVPEGKAWRLAEFSATPVERLVAAGVAFGSPGEQAALETERARDRGLVINAAGEVLEGSGPAPSPTPAPGSSTLAPSSPASGASAAPAGGVPSVSASPPNVVEGARRPALTMACAAASAVAAVVLLAAGGWLLRRALRRRRARPACDPRPPGMRPRP